MFVRRKDSALKSPPFISVNDPEAFNAASSPIRANGRAQSNVVDLVAYGLQGVRVRLCTIKVILSPRERNSKLRNC
jgi:hypothetical protein